METGSEYGRYCEEVLQACALAYSRLHPRSFVTVVTAKSPPAVEVEARFEDNVNEIPERPEIDAGSLAMLARMQVLSLDSSSGNDPALSAIYDHYYLASPEQLASAAAQGSGFGLAWAQRFAAEAEKLILAKKAPAAPEEGSKPRAPKL